jgi:hypothetical protein
MPCNWATALLLVLATAAGAADTTTTKSKSKAPPSTVTAEQAKAVRTTKATFMSAVGSCTRPGACDPKSPSRDPDLVALLETAQDAFMQACRQCATDAACEEERVRIRDGRGRFGFNICMQGDSKAAPTTTGAKKP